MESSGRRPLSAVVISFNEKERIAACLESLAWADEIVVVDSESTDRTVHIARRYTERIIVRPWPGFAAQKNFGLDQAHGDWILSLDADFMCTGASGLKHARAFASRRRLEGDQDRVPGRRVAGQLDGVQPPRGNWLRPGCGICRRDP